MFNHSFMHLYKHSCMHSRPVTFACVSVQHKPAPSLPSNVLANMSCCQQDDSIPGASSRLSIGDRPLAASPSTAANRRLSMPIMAGSTQQGQENTPPPFHPARQTILGNDLAGSSRHSSCRVRNSSNKMSFPGFTTGCNMRFPTSLIKTGGPKGSPGAVGVMMGMVVKEPVTPVSIKTKPADSAVTVAPDLGSPVSPPSLIENTCRGLDTGGMVGGSPAKPCSISRDALGSAVQRVAPSEASLSSGTGKAKRARARKAAPAGPPGVKTRNQIAQEEHLRRMQLRSG